MLRDKAIPLYYQISTVLRQKILSGELPPGSAFPSEESLAEEYEVSRITIRQALSLLDQEGLILRQRGRGTFVAERAGGPPSPKWTGSIEDLILMGIQTTTRTLEFGETEAPERIRERLELPPKSRILRIEKIRLVEGGAFSHVVNYLPASIGAKIRKADLAVKPLLMILEEDLKIPAAEATQTVEATIADSAVASLLEVRVGDPLLKVERTVFDRHGRPVEAVDVLYRADKYFFTVNLKRQRSQNSVGWKTA